jgi:hypothetical protein
MQCGAGGAGRGEFSTKTRSGVHKVTNTYTARESLTNHRFKPKPNKARFKPKPNKSQTDYRMRGESFNIGLEASVDNLLAVPGLLVNPYLELHDVSTGPATRRLSHYDLASKTMLFGRQKNERNVLQVLRMK